MQAVKIYVQLLNEGIVCYRPTEATCLGEGKWRVLACQGYDPEDETWEFPPGSIVSLQKRTLSAGEALVAVAPKTA